MSLEWVHYRRMGKFLVRLDVITYEQLQRYLTSGII